MYTADANVHNRIMDDDDEMVEFRIRKLRTLVEKSGGPAAFAREYSERGSKAGADKEISETYVSQILNKHRKFRERAARNMEHRGGLPKYYFDTEDELITEQNIKSPDNLHQLKQEMIDMIISLDESLDLVRLEYVKNSLTFAIGLVSQNTHNLQNKDAPKED